MGRPVDDRDAEIPQPFCGDGVHPLLQSAIQLSYQKGDEALQHLDFLSKLVSWSSRLSDENEEEDKVGQERKPEKGGKDDGGCCHTRLHYV